MLPRVGWHCLVCFSTVLRPGGIAFFILILVVNGDMGAYICTLKQNAWN